jgi:hypothetical protein
MFTDFLSVVRQRLARPLPLVDYLFLTTQTHALCGSLAFFAMLGFYPLSLLLVSLAKHVLRSPQALDVVRLALHSYYPIGQDFLLRNLEVSSRLFDDVTLHGALWILLGGAGVSSPRDGLQQLWGFRAPPYWRISSGWRPWPGDSPWPGPPPACRSWSARRSCPSAASVGAAALYLVYRFLPHGRSHRRGAPAAILTAVSVEGGAAFALVLPLLKLPEPGALRVRELPSSSTSGLRAARGACLAAEATRACGPYHRRMRS